MPCACYCLQLQHSMTLHKARDFSGMRSSRVTLSLLKLISDLLSSTSMSRFIVGNCEFLFVQVLLIKYVYIENSTIVLLTNEL